LGENRATQLLGRSSSPRPEGNHPRTSQSPAQTRASGPHSEISRHKSLAWPDGDGRKTRQRKSPSPRSWRAFVRIPWPTPTSLSSTLALISASFLAYTQPSQLGEGFSAQFGLRWGGVWFSRGHFVRLKGA